VFRDGTNGSTLLPVYFARLFPGVTSQRTRAHAIAGVFSANTTKCLKPWYVPDRFTGPNWPDDPFEPGVDTYIPQSQSNTTGYTRNDIGELLVLRLDDATTASQYQRLDLANGEQGYRDMITGCASVNPQTGGPFVVGDYVPTKTGHGSIPQQNNVMDDLFHQDWDAEWHPGTNSVVNSCADDGSCTCGMCANGMAGKISPLIVTVALVNPGDIDHGHVSVQMVAFASFFLDRHAYESDGTIHAYLVEFVGSLTGGGGPQVAPGNSLLLAPGLVQ
jgi:hypothetical protein